MQAQYFAIAHLVRRIQMPFRLPAACWKHDLPGMQSDRLARMFTFSEIMKLNRMHFLGGKKHVSLSNISGLFQFRVCGVNF